MRFVIVVALFVGWPVAAQCPDGAPPPCRPPLPTTAVPASNSIAVLYFDNLTRDSAYEYLADGLTEELISRLGRVRRLDVKSRFESRRVREQRTVSAAVLGRALNVAYLLSGSVQPVAGRLRVTVELVRAASGARIWSEVLNRAGSDLLAAQEDIAGAVVRAVAGELLPDERAALSRRATRDSGAYDLYLRGRFLVSRLTERGLIRALDLYSQALARDSGFALAWAGIGQVWWWLGARWRPPLDAYPKARLAAERALALDSTVGLAFVGLATAAQLLDYDFARAESLGRKAIAHDPRLPDAHALLGNLLVQRGRPADALIEADRAWALDSLSGVVIVSRFQTMRGLGREADALAVARSFGGQALISEGLFASTEVTVLVTMKRCDEARDVIRGTTGREWWDFRNVGIVASCLGQREVALAALDSLAALSRTAYVSPMAFATIYSALGERDAAIEWMERAYEGRDFFLLFANVPRWEFRSAQADPRFAGLMKRIGLPWPAPALPN